MEHHRQENASQATQALSARLVRYFHEEVPREEGIHIQVQAGPPNAARADRCTLQFTLPDGSLLNGHLRVENTGGNMYLVEADVEAHTRSFSICLITATAGSKNHSGKQICEFFLDELKRIAGTQHLREISVQPDAT